MAKTTSPSRKVTFSILAPEAESVYLAACFNSWSRDTNALRKQKSGLWKTTITLPPGRYEYRFIVDGQWMDDPACDQRAPTPYGSENNIREVSPD